MMTGCRRRISRPFASAVLGIGCVLAAGPEANAEDTTTAGRVETGRLGPDDDVLQTGAFHDVYRVDASAGERYVIELKSDDFDTYLMVRSDDDTDLSLENDDYEGDFHRSRLVLETEFDGEYEVLVTSFEAGESGAYLLTISDPVPSRPDPVQLEEQGELAAGDERRGSGEFFDRFTLTLEQGDTIEIDLVSDDFDACLLVRHADDAEILFENDDRDRDTTDSRITMTVPRSGVYEILATTFAANETGAYHLTVNRSGSDGIQREETGELVRGDDELDSGEYFDTFVIDATAGESFVVDLESDEFDTYLLVRAGDDPAFVLENDDFNGSTNHSQVRLLAPESGSYDILVTSFEPGESGTYRMTIRSSAFTPDTRREVGELGPGDQKLDGGEYVDTYHFEGRPGQHVRVELRSHEFDSYLLLQDPGGNFHENDDVNDRTDLSMIEMELTEAGDYSVGVTSFEKAESGAYELLIHFDQPTPVTPIRDYVPLAENGLFPGNLSDDDASQDDRYADFFSVALTAGQRAIIRMQSDDFDTVLLLTYPDGTRVKFDDELGGLNAAIDLIPEESGEYYVAATSYDSEVTGDYSLQVTLDAPGRPVGRRGNIPVTADQRILGVFVGIGDYENDEDDLEFCDRDAEVLYGILQREFNLRPEDSVLLVNEEATVDRVRSALQEIGARAQPDDLLMFFFSGHGDQMAGPEDTFDPDGIHETLSLYDGELLDDDLAALINGSPAGISLVTIDACFSGGFAKDVVSARGRMGIFSSEEDVLSVVPGRFRAGGYLSRFMAEAVSERRHDSDRNDDGCLTAHELSHYLGERYLQEVRSTKAWPKSDDEFVDPEENLSFQRLVIDRGGLSHDQVLFCWE